MKLEDPWKEPGVVSETLVPPASGPETPDTSDPVAVARESLQDLMNNPMGYLFAGLAYFGMVLGIVAVALLVLGLGLAPGLALENEALTMIGGLVGGSVYTVLIVGTAVFLYPMMTTSLMLAIRDQRSAGAPIGFRSAFDRMWLRVGPVVRLYLLTQLLAMVGMLFLYIPGLVVLAVGMLAFPIAVFENVGAVEALQLAWAHAKRHASWHVGVWIILLGLFVVIELTVVGLLVLWPLMVCYQLIAYEKAFGAEGARMQVARMEGRL
jgi:uncharacterized membrane protein